MTEDILNDMLPKQLPTLDEAEALRHIRRWRSAVVVMWVMHLPVIFAALFAWPDRAFVVVACWLGLFVFAARKVRGPCPRCQQWFPVHERGMNPWEKGCPNCGLRAAPKVFGE